MHFIPSPWPCFLVYSVHLPSSSRGEFVRIISFALRPLAGQTFSNGWAARAPSTHVRSERIHPRRHRLRKRRRRPPGEIIWATIFPRRRRRRKGEGIVVRRCPHLSLSSLAAPPRREKMTEKDLDSRSARSGREVLLLLLLFSFSFSLLLFPTPLLGERQGGSARQAHEEKVPVEKKDRTGRREEGGRPHSVSARLLAGLAGGVCMYVWWVHNAKRGEGEGETELWRARWRRRLRFHQPFLGMCRHDWTQPETCVNHLLSVMRNSRRILVLWEFPFPRMSVGERERAKA